MNTVIISGVMPSCIEEVFKSVAKYEKSRLFSSVLLQITKI